MVKRVVRSTRVPIAERSRPMSRSPSQWPGTARSSASAGRSLISTSGVTWPHALRPRRALEAPQRPPRAKARDQLALERATPLDVERLVDRLVADPHGFIIGEVDLQPVGDLLRAPCPPTPSPAVRLVAARSRQVLRARATSPSAALTCPTVAPARSCAAASFATSFAVFGRAPAARPSTGRPTLGTRACRHAWPRCGATRGRSSRDHDRAGGRSHERRTLGSKRAISSRSVNDR